MAIDYAKIFISHVRNVSKANKWLTEGEAVPTYRSWIRAEQLLRLDVVLIKHRERYSAPWEPLFGQNGITHLFATRYGWSPEQVRMLSFADVLLSLQQDLAEVDIPPEVLALPEYVRQSDEFEILSRGQYRTELPPCQEHEWDHTIAERDQGQRKPQ
ncbi:ECs1072 family phage-associated protein [Klebsiella quasipneumoniae]|uniref:ECs1072 family phage-associated protein n=1 Tax=Klebsiella quasipneumoniae TaxID=1463165 RepID=UPI00111987F1